MAIPTHLPQLPPLQPVQQTALPAAQAETDEDSGRQSLSKLLQQQRQQHMQALQKQQTKPRSPSKSQSSNKQAASQRAGLLKQRLDTLKSIIAKLPPGDHKMLLRELKQIAKELAALSKQLGGSSGGQAGLPQTAFGQLSQGGFSPTEGADPNVATGETAHASSPAVAEPAIVDTAVAEAAAAPDDLALEELASQATNTAAQPASDPTEATDHTDTPNHKIGSPTRNNNEDKQLRALLNEAKQALKQALSMLKAKHQPRDDDSKKLIQSIEKELASLDKELQHATLGSTSMDTHSEADSSHFDGNLGGFIDTQA